MYSPQFSFVSFNGDTGYSLPVRSWSDVSFQVLGVKGGVSRVELIDGEENVLETVTHSIQIGAEAYFVTLGFQLDVPPCFRIKIAAQNREVAVSNLFHRDTSRHTSRVSYLCDGNEFGFQYASDLHLNRVRLPILLKHPQYPQSDSVYKKFSGNRVVLSATIDKEWQLETDYISDELHGKLLVALSHDSLWVDGKRYTKSGEYSVDWGSILEQNDEQTAKASCKVAENVTHRNSSSGDGFESGDVFEVLPRSLMFDAA